MNKKIASAPHIDRDLSWMYFNRRILQEAMKTDVPLLERLSFLGIYSIIWMIFPCTYGNPQSHCRE